MLTPIDDVPEHDTVDLKEGARIIGYSVPHTRRFFTEPTEKTPNPSFDPTFPKPARRRSLKCKVQLPKGALIRWKRDKLQ
jgi:hypothetical protein